MDFESNPSSLNPATHFDADPDCTIKMTDDQLSQAGREARQRRQNQNAEKSDSDNLSSTVHFGVNAIENLADIVHTVFLPDIPLPGSNNQDDELRSTHITSAKPAKNDLSTEAPNEGALQYLSDAYQVLQRFAAGGQGYLSKAQDKALKRMVALKSLRPELLDNPAIRNAFITEALITAQLQHPSVVSVYGLLRDDKDGVHLAMQLVNGESLSEQLARISRASNQLKLNKWVYQSRLRKRLEIFQRICDPIAYAHSKGIIHCDLKPENVMLGHYGEVYVMDWGIAKIIRDNQGRMLPPQPDQTLDGTPRYLPPEALNGAPRDERADIYALGMILFELTTLQHAYDGRNVQEVMQMIRSGNRKPVLHKYGMVVPRDLIAIIDKAIAYDPDDRYQTVAELAMDIQHVQSGEAVSANPEGLLMSLYRIIRRYSRTLIVLTLVGWAIASFLTAKTLRDSLSASTDELKKSQYNQKLDAVDGLVVRSAMQLSNQLATLSGNLRNIATLTGYLLSNDQPRQPRQGGELLLINSRQFSPGADGTPPPRGFHSPVYRGYIDPTACAWHAPANANPEAVKKNLEEVAAVAMPLRFLLLSSDGDYPGGDLHSLQRLTKRLGEEGLLIRRAYLGLEETGLHLAYPANGNYHSDYDNRTRKWYMDAKQAAAKGNYEPIWGEPYTDISGAQTVVTCSMPIIDRQKRFRGVVAFDLFFERFTRLLRDTGNRSQEYIQDKYLFSANGQVLCTLHVNGATNTPENHYLTPKRIYDAVIDRRDNSGYGHCAAPGNSPITNRKFTLHYAYIPVLNMFLVEKCSEEELLNALRHQLHAPEND